MPSGQAIMSGQPTDIVVTAIARTPFGRFDGALKGINAPQLGALAMNEALDRSGLDPQKIDAVFGGIGMMAGAIITPVRQALLMSKLPETTPSATIDRACCSGMTSIGLGMKDIRLEEARALLCGGFESLSNTPVLWPRQKAKLGDVNVTDPLVIRGLVVDRPIAVYTGDESIRHGVDRAMQDDWARQSHERYFAAEEKGYFEPERFSVEVSDAKGRTQNFTSDEAPRRDTTAEKLSTLKTVYGGKTVTAGNAPGLSDGAAFLVVMRRDFAEENGLTPLARLVDYVQVAGGPTSGTVTPGTAIMKLARRHNRGHGQWDLIEINEAYAATPLVSTLALADGDKSEASKIRGRTNIHGGAVAIGHPLGASGARLVMTLINGLRRRGGGTGVAAICGGFGQGDALMVEVD